jgi:hypothetical protein
MQKNLVIEVVFGNGFPWQRETYIVNFLGVSRLPMFVIMFFIKTLG